MATPEEEQVISSGWCAAGITNALKNGETCLELLDPFADIDPLLSEPSVKQDDGNMLQIEEGLIQQLSFRDEKYSCDSEWEIEDGNVSDVIAQELWFVEKYSCDSEWEIEDAVSDVIAQELWFVIFLDF